MHKLATELHLSHATYQRQLLRRPVVGFVASHTSPESVLKPIGQSLSIFTFHLDPHADDRKCSCQTSPRTNQNTDKAYVIARLSNEMIVSNEITVSEKKVPV